LAFASDAKLLLVTAILVGLAAGVVGLAAHDECSGEDGTDYEDARSMHGVASGDAKTTCGSE
jgi:hypothetical protein